MRNLSERAQEAKDKKAAIGPDVDLSSFTAETVRHDYVEDLKKLPEKDRLRMIDAGIDANGREYAPRDGVEKGLSQLDVHTAGD